MNQATALGLTAKAASVSPESAGEPVSATAALRSKHARAGKAMAAATFAMAGASGLQALLYLRSFGVDGRTDGFFAAFALYAIFGVFSQSIRVTSAPLLVGARPRLTPGAFAAALALIAALVAIAVGPLGGLMAKLLAPGLDPADRAVTRDALPILGGAMVLQLWAAGAATLLAMRDRFGAVATAYGTGALAGLATYVAVEGAAGELALGYSMLGMAVVTCGLMLAFLRPHPGAATGLRRAVAPTRMLATTGLILGRTGVYLAFNGLFLITLAFASRFEPGDATVLSYAYLYASYLVAGTGFALGMTRISDMTRGARSAWRDVVPDTVAPGFRYAMLLAAPALAALVVCGAPLAGALFPSSLSGGEVDTLRVFAALLSAWTVAALLVNLLLPAMFAIGRARLVNGLALPLVALHLAVTALGGAVAGVTGVVAASCVAPMAFATVLLLAESRAEGRRLAGCLARDGLRFAVLAAGAFALGGAAAAPLGGVAGAMAAGAVGAVVYAAAVRVAAPRQVRVLVRGLRPELG